MIAVRLDDIKITNSGGDGHQGNAKPNQAAIYDVFSSSRKLMILTPKHVSGHTFFFKRDYVSKKIDQASWHIFFCEAEPSSSQIQKSEVC